jgi:GT2 family glycosyltransferase
MNKAKSTRLIDYLEHIVQAVAFIQQYYPQVVLIKSRENVGFCVANNRMAAMAKGHYLYC